MRQRSLIFVLLAVFFTVGTIYFARSWLAKEHAQVVQEPPKVERQGVSVLVAARDLATGSFIRPEDMRWQVWPEGQMADNYLLKDKDTPESLSGAVVKLRIAAGEPVTGNRVIKPGDRGFLAAVLSPGMRAVSVAVTPISGVSGLVFPGDHVDMILSHQLRNMNPNATAGTNDAIVYASETIQTDLRILAIDQSTADVEGKPVLARTVTFEVTPKQVEAIEVASTIGSLYLSLRGLAGSNATGEDGAVSDDDVQQRGVSSVSHTLDSDVSPLIHRGASGQQRVVTILRGESGKGGGGAATVPVTPTPGAPPVNGTPGTPPANGAPAAQTSAP